ncbi:MAG: hypothetical protein IT347_05000 [Candidatus Eisenbacteria bacterium]|nr:hypothetical protein [Candidatus Eisenbacteria bacterium]
MFSLARRLSASLALFALALCFPQGSLMLCASEGGHLALEATCEAGDLPVHADAHPATTQEHCDGDGGCGPCQDAQVGTELSAGRVRDFGQAAHLVAAPAPVTSAFAFTPAPAGQSARSSATALPPDPFSRVQAGNRLRL